MKKTLFTTRIYAGEGLRLSLEWEGETTAQGIKNRLTRARCGGDRNAYAVINPYETTHGFMAGANSETGEPTEW